jgi:uncharacterized membrane protein
MSERQVTLRYAVVKESRFTNPYVLFDLQEQRILQHHRQYATLASAERAAYRANRGRCTNCLSDLANVEEAQG